MKLRLFAICMMMLMCVASVSSKKREKRSVVRIETTAGVIRVALWDDTPRHRDNFLKLVSQGFYDGTLFHRVIKDFMIQAGDPDSKNAKPGQLLGDGDLDYTLAPEFQIPYIYHLRGALAAARESDDVNPEQRSSACQFYIVYGRSFGPASLRDVRATLEEKGIEMSQQMYDNYMQYGGTPHLDGQYTVFGQVIEGMDVVRAIQELKTDKNDRPIEDFAILKAVVEQWSKDAKKR